MNKPRTIGDAMNRLKERGFTSPRGLLTGIKAIDRAAMGLFGGEVTIIAAPTGTGKTVLATTIMENIAQRGETVGMISLEMNEVVIAERLLASRMGIAVSQLRDQENKLTPKQLALANKLAPEIAKLPIYIEDVGSTTGQGAYDVIIDWAKQGAKMVVVDYVQMMAGAGDSKQVIVGEAARMVRAAAKDADIPVILVSQMNREHTRRANPRPRLSDLRDSGEVENIADNVWFLFRPDEADSSAVDIIFAKFRNGETQDVSVRFNGVNSRYTDPE